MDTQITDTAKPNLVAVMSVVAIAGLGFGTSIPLLSILLERAGYSSTLIGINTALHSVAALIILPYAPSLLRRFGPARLLMTALLVIGLSLLTMRAFVNLWVWTPMRMIFGCALAMMFTTSEYWVNAIATDATRGRLVGLYATMFSLGWAVGPLLLGALGALSWTPVLVTAALLGLSMVPLLLMRNAAPVPPETAPGGLWQIVREAPAAALAPFVYGAVEIGVFALLPVYALHQGLSPAEGAAMLAALSAGNVALQYPIGWLADRMDRSLILILCALSGVLGALSLPFVIHAPILLYSTLFLWGGVVVGLYTMGLVLLGAKFSGPRLATANSAVMILYSAGGLVAPLFSGVAMDLLPPHGLAWVMGLLCGGYALFAVKDLTRAASSLGSRPSE